MAYLDYNGLSYFKQKNDSLYAKATDLSNLSDVVAQKANIDGSYESMTVGNAEQLVSSVGITEQTPYNFRTSGGSTEIGDREELNAVVGVSVPWNQLVRNGDFSSTTVWSIYQGTYTTANNEATITTASGKEYGSIFQDIPNIYQHKLLVMVDAKVVDATNAMLALTGNVNLQKSTTSSTYETLYAIIDCSVNAQAQRVQARSTGDGLSAKFRNFKCFDLTVIFGSTIADYIYSLEQSSAGACVAYFKKLFPKPYYAYNSGALLSARTSAHRMVGFNAYNPTTGAAKVVGGMQYQITGAYTALSLDGTTITPDANGKFTQSANGTLTVTGGNSTTTCVHLVWDGERNDEFEPYEAHEYALDDITLRGMLKLDASNNLYANGDRYLPDGTVERWYVEYTFSGSEDWGFNESNGFFQCSFTTPNGVTAGTHLTSNGIFVNVVNGHYARAYLSANPSLSASSNMNTVFASGTKMVYELVTPTTETASPYQQTQIVDDFGTEEFVDAAVEANERDVAIPVGNETVYKPNLRAKLEMAPDSPSNGDGLYVVQQISGENTYVPLVVPNEIPEAPTTDGTYVLKATVSDGTATYSWVSDS